MTHATMGSGADHTGTDRPTARLLLGGPLLLALILASHRSGSAQNQEAPSRPARTASEVAVQLANPNTSLGSLGFNRDGTAYTRDVPGAGDQNGWRLFFQPVLPYPLAEGADLFVRPLIRLVVRQPVPMSGAAFDDVGSDLGDIGIDAAVGRSLAGGMIVLGGVLGTWPTATNNAVGGLHAESITAGDVPGSFKIPGDGAMSLAIGGFIKAVAIMDSRAEAMGANFLPGTVGTRRSDRDGAFSLDAARTRLFLDAPARLGDDRIRGRVEADLNSNNDVFSEQEAVTSTPRPDGVLALEGEGPRWHLRLGGIVRRIEYLESDDVDIAEDAWGLALTGHVDLSRADRLVFSGTLGEGLGRFVLGITATSGSGLNPDTGALEARDNCGGSWPTGTGGMRACGRPRPLGTRGRSRSPSSQETRS